MFISVDCFDRPEPTLAGRACFPFTLHTFSLALPFSSPFFSRSYPVSSYPVAFGLRVAMEYHFVPPEERARDEKGNLLPWGYVYKEYVLQSDATPSPALCLS